MKKGWARGGGGGRCFVGGRLRILDRCFCILLLKMWMMRVFVMYESDMSNCGGLVGWLVGWLVWGGGN